MAIPSSDGLVGSGALSASWTTELGSFTQVSGTGTHGNSTTSNAASWNADTFNADQKVTCIPANDNAGPLLRVSGTAGTTKGYYVVGSGSGTGYELGWLNNGDNPIALATGALTLNYTTDVLGLSVIGTTLQVTKNSVNVGSGVTDVNLATGQPGIFTYNVNGLKTWTADNAGATAVLTGTAVPTITEADVVTGGKTIIITLTGDTWVAAGATFDAQRQNIINGIDSAQAEANGWDAEVKAKEVVGAVVRTSATVVTVTLSAAAAYNITVQETITVTIPTSALVTSTAPIIATPTFAVTAIGGFIPGGDIQHHEGFLTILVM